MFDEAYALVVDNEGQKRAVDTTEGPVLVVAGPGTGKTQLLSLRVGKILQNNPTILPSNILCLTFTDSAAANLRERLIHHVGLGQDAYQVAIHTFNSFGNWIMTTYPEYFGHWREVTTADELTTYRVLENILEGFPGNHPLARKTPDGTFTTLGQLHNLIGDSKRSNISPADLKTIITDNGRVFDQVTPIIAKHWPRSMKNSSLPDVYACVDALSSLTAEPPVSGITSLATVLVTELEQAAAEAETLPERSKTIPFTKWKNDWLELDAAGQWALKAAKHQDRLVAACAVYEKYQQRLKDASMVDFSDQIMTILAALKEHDDLRLNLQERFQYIMIDEYQDTNRSQLQLAQYLTDAAVHEGRPNILAVGDDDQAIYRFQGADISNIQAFREAYKDPLIITLQENYRSINDIILPAKAVSKQITSSLANTADADKQLNPHTQPDSGEHGAALIAADDEAGHYNYIAAQIKKLTDSGVSGKAIAVLARQRNQLDALVPYLREQGIAMDYERRENVLEQPHITALISLARFVDLLNQDARYEAAAMLPEILSHPMWNIAPEHIWRISQEAYRAKRSWLDVIFDQQDSPAYKPVTLLYTLALQSETVPLERAIDILIGNEALENSESSPFKDYYFSKQKLEEAPGAYLTFLSHLACLRNHVREHQATEQRTLHIHDFITYIDAFSRAGLTMIDTAPHRERDDAVQLMTVHKAKGMEFTAVFVIGLLDAVWDKASGRNNKRFSYPANLLTIKPENNELDDALRLLFVAMTRAKQLLRLCYFKKSEDGKQHEVFAPLVDSGLEVISIATDADMAALTRQYEARWQARHLSVGTQDMQTLLGDTLKNYKLSATHLNHFLDLPRGGPAYFLTQNLLRFPSAPSAYASYGTAVHAALRYAHEFVARGQTPAVSQILAVFQAELAKAHLSDHDAARFLQQGTDNLPKFLASQLANFSEHQKAEVDFSFDGASVGEAQLTGKLDVITLDDKTRSLAVTDYKTGSSFSAWHATASTPEHTRIKQHHYRQQLLFYKLLVDGSSQWGKKGWQTASGKIQFVEPNEYGKIVTVELVYEAEELARFEKLISAVWQKITQLDLPDTTTYDPTLAGILQFEEDLLSGMM